jgi:flotillin
MAKNIADPISSIDCVKIYGSGDSNGVSAISGNVPVVMQQVLDTMKETTGVDMSDIIRSQTINAKTDRNILIEGVKGGTVEVDLDTL